MSEPVQELPTAYKSVRPYCLPLRGRRGHVPALQAWEEARRRGRRLGVGVVETAEDTDE